MTEDPTYDVTVLGGGPSGLTAAIQAARAGAKVLLIEKAAFLGGTTTVAGVNAIQTFFAFGEQVISGIGWELVKRHYEVLGEDPQDPPEFGEAGVTNTIVDKAIFTAVCDQTVLEAGVELRLHTMLGDIQQVEDAWKLTLCGKEGLHSVLSTIVIDCSGDANAVARAGLEVIRRTERQPGTLVMKFTGYDKETVDLPTIQANFDKEVEAGRLKRSDAGFKGPSIEPLLFWDSGNAIHVVSENATDSTGRTAMELEARKVMLRLVKFFRTQPGLEDLTVGWFAPECGVRETTVIKGRSTITYEDYVSGRVWEDAVSNTFYPIDVHTDEGVDYHPLKRGVVPTIPYSALLPEKGHNILTAGRCISGDRMAFSGYRVQASCMAMGQAAGAAAAIAIAKGIAVEEVDPAEIRDLLREHQALVPEPSS